LNLRSPFELFVAAFKNPFPGNGDCGSKKPGSTPLGAMAKIAFSRRSPQQMQRPPTQVTDPMTLKRIKLQGRTDKILLFPCQYEGDLEKSIGALNFLVERKNQVVRQLMRKCNLSPVARLMKKLPFLSKLREG
jgi:hypothetical protein